MSVREKCVEAMARAICQSDERNGGAPWDWYKPKAREPYYEAAGDALDAVLTILADGDSAIIAAAVEAAQRIGPHDHIGIPRAMLGVVKGEADDD